MKVDGISKSYTFTACVHEKLIHDGERFYNKRNLTILYDKFRRQVAQMEFYGEPDTIIKHYFNQKDAKHVLYIENKTINKKQGAVIRVSEKFSDILNYFNSLKPKTIEEAEDALRD